MVLEKTPESSLNSKEIKPVNPKDSQLWIFIGRSDAEAEVSILWSPDEKSRLLGKDLDAEKNWRQKKKGEAENEMVIQRHWLNGHEFEQTAWDSEGLGSLVCCSPWDCKELDMTDWTITVFNKYSDSVCRRAGISGQKYLNLETLCLHSRISGFCYWVTNKFRTGWWVW